MNWLNRIRQDKGKFSAFLLLLFLPFFIYIAVLLVAFDADGANHFAMDNLVGVSVFYVLLSLAGLIIVITAIRALAARQSRGFAVTALLLGGLLGYYFGNTAWHMLEVDQIKSGSSEWVGKTAPPFNFTAVDGTKISSADLRGKWVLLNHWATWCAPCVIEIPDLMAFAHENPDDVVLLGYSVEEADAVRKHLLKTDYDYPLVALSDAEFEALGAPYNKVALPTTFFISPDGKFGQIKYGMASPKEIRAGVK